MSPTPQTPPTDRPLTAGDINWSAPLPDALWSHFNSTYGLSREEASEAAGEVLDIIAQQSARPATSAASEVEEHIDAGLEAWLTARDLMPRGPWDWPSIVSMLDHHEAALASPPVSERERELERALAKAIEGLEWIGRLIIGSRAGASVEERENDLGLSVNHIQSAALRAAAEARKALTAQPQEPV